MQIALLSSSLDLEPRSVHTVLNLNCFVNEYFGSLFCSTGDFIAIFKHSTQNRTLLDKLCHRAHHHGLFCTRYCHLGSFNIIESYFEWESCEFCLSMKIRGSLSHCLWIARERSQPMRTLKVLSPKKQKAHILIRSNEAPTVAILSSFTFVASLKAKTWDLPILPVPYYFWITQNSIRIPVKYAFTKYQLELLNPVEVWWT